MIKIEGITISQADVGKKVIYFPRHAKGNPQHPDVEVGEIRSWSDSFVFVDYGTGHGKATDPLDLEWEEPDGIAD